MEAVVFFPDGDGGEYGCMLGDDFDDLGKGDPLVIVNKLVTGSLLITLSLLTRFRLCQEERAAAPGRRSGCRIGCGSSACHRARPQAIAPQAR